VNLTDYKTITFERSGQIIYATLNRPDRMNRVNTQMHDELATLFEDLRHDPLSDVIVLRGAGRSFSAGGDVESLNGVEPTAESWDPIMRDGKRILYALLDCDKPVICKIQGHAFGVAASIALFCDVVVMAETAVIADTHVMVGLATGDGGAAIWPQHIGYMRAKYYLLTGAKLNGKQAAEIGLVTFAVPDEELDEKVEEVASTIASGAVRAARLTKAAINHGLKQSIMSTIDMAIAYEALSGAGTEHRDKIAAFLGGRKSAPSNKPVD